MFYFELGFVIFIEDFEKSKLLLREAETETKMGSNIMYSKIRQLISWEILYTEMLQFQYEFKNYGLYLFKELHKLMNLYLFNGILL